MHALQCDEIWGFCYAKQKNVPEQHKGTPGYGDVWTWAAIDADTKLVPSWLVGERTLSDCWTFMDDLRDRMRGRVQVSTDAHATYRGVIRSSSGGRCRLGSAHQGISIHAGRSWPL